jgi:hypothetical protein
MQAITQISRYLSIFLIVVTISVVSCKSPEQRAQDFIESYNRGANKLINTIISSTSAYFISKDDIGLKFNTNLIVENIDKELYLRLLPDLIANLLSTTPAARQMIKDGITFNISFLDKNNNAISKMLVDDKKLSELLAKSEEKRADISEDGDFNQVSDDIKQMLTTLNANLPYKDSGTGITILNVRVANPQELTYTVEIPLELVSLIKGKDAKQMLRNEIINSENFRTVISGMDGLGLKYVRYLYKDPSNFIINEFKLTKEDLN